MSIKNFAKDNPGKMKFAVVCPQSYEIGEYEMRVNFFLNFFFYNFFPPVKTVLS